MNFFQRKRILVTGACGTIGSQLISQLLQDPLYQVQEVIGIDNNENQIFFHDQKYIQDPRIHFYIADVRDFGGIDRLMEDIDIVFHTAAMKHVIVSERSPEQAIQTNIIGVQNIIDSATKNNVGNVVFTSSDKAVNPTNVMGTSKLMGERLITAANSRQRGQGTIFSSTRFGNVLGSSGSVIPIFHNQIATGRSITVTDVAMTRFVMSTDQAVSLVIASAEKAQGGEVFITKMPVIRIMDLAKTMIMELGPIYEREPERVNIDIIGCKPGEKVYEELMSQEETRRAFELDQYFVVLPAFRGIYQDISYDYNNIISKTVGMPYTSAEEPPLSTHEITNFLKENQLFQAPSEDTFSRYWPGDKKGN